MRAYVDFLDRFKWIIVFAVPMIVFALASNLKHLEMDGSYRIWFGEESKILKNYDDFRATFGNDDAVIVVLKDDSGIFNRKALQSIDNITQKFWQMKYVARVDSITNYQHIYASQEDVDDIIVEDFIQNISDASDEYLEQRKQIAINDSLIVNSFVSADATTTMIVAKLVPKVSDGSDKSMEIMSAVRQILQIEHNKTGYKYWINGGPAMNEAFVQIGTSDAVTFTPIVIIVTMLLLLIIFRRFSGAIIPLAVVIFTFMTVLSVQVAFGYKLNNFTANLPVFIVAIGIAHSVHIYILWLSSRREGRSSKEATLHSLQKNLLAVTLTSITTAIGFATLMISTVIPVFTLGVATASGAILVYLISITWMPALLLLFTKEIEVKNQNSKESRFGYGYGEFIIRRHKSIIATTSLVFAILAGGLFMVKIDSNTIRYFDESVEFRKSTEFLSDNLTGPMIYEIVVDSAKINGIKDPEFMRTVEQFCSEFKSKFSDVIHTSSLVDIVKRFNLVMNQNESIPETQELIAQYLLLYSLSLPMGMEINDKMDLDEQHLRISAQVNIVDTSKDLEMIDFVHEWWQKSPYSAQANGQTVMFAYMQEGVTDTLIYSLSLAIVLVSIVMLLVFKRIRLLWIFIIPNVLPVMLVVGLMGYLKINIDIGVAIAGAIIIGVAVDDTIHFLVKYFDARERGLGLKESLDEVIHYAGRAIIFTTIILSTAFATFSFSDFAPNQNFGIVTASALIIALIVDLLLLPALLVLAEKNSKPMSLS